MCTHMGSHSCTCARLCMHICNSVCMHVKMGLLHAACVIMSVDTKGTIEPSACYCVTVKIDTINHRSRRYHKTQLKNVKFSFT